MGKSNLQIRNEILSIVKDTYLGPISKTSDHMPDLEEIINVSPKDIYTTGILFPQIRDNEELFLTEEDYLESKFENQDEEVNSNDLLQSRNKPPVIVDDQEEELRLTTEFNPSSIAISFLVHEKDKIFASINFGKYLPLNPGQSGSFKRNHNELNFSILCESGSLNILENDIPDWKIQSNHKSILIEETDKNVKVNVVLRRNLSNDEMSKFRILTISIINSKKCERKKQKKVENCIFQPEIIVNSKTGFHNFPDHANLSLLSDEEIELKFMYRNYKNYGQGHGCAVNWEFDKHIVSQINSSIIPVEEIKGVDFDPDELKGIEEVLFMKCLTDSIPDYSFTHLISNLNSFVDVYSKWIDKQSSLLLSENLDPEFDKASKRVIEKCHDLNNRMKKGVELLKSPKVLRAFLDSNKAMFYQRVMADFSKHRLKEGRVQSNDSQFDDILPPFDEIPYNSISGSIWSNGKFKSTSDGVHSTWYLAKWRPFQLAFLLSQIEGIVDEQSIDRKTVDLLWFSTGGGKTEAYLGLIAFNIFYKRQTNKYEYSGVTVMMRYTLRMLNKQQFSRANILICACELIRFQDSNLYGDTRISNGLWVGGSLTPNKHSGSKDYPGNNELLLKYISGIESKNTLDGDYSPPVFSCPCCGNKLVKEIQSDDQHKLKVKGRWGYNQLINTVKRKPFPSTKDLSNPYYMFCTNTKCHFHVPSSEFYSRKNDNTNFINKTLPIYYVDEDVYQNKPTLLFSTVDKYAQLAWKVESFGLFNFDEKFNRIASPPSLIVQDELHLISSSLGTIYSLFEFVIDELCTENGVKPKIIGATATVRNAERQCVSIYNREKYSQFPPSGIHIDDSFYARKKEIDEKARIYVGIMPSGFTSTTAKLRLDSVLHDGVNCISRAASEQFDNYYTLLAYFNTVKELGKYRTLLEDDMVSYRKFLSSTFGNYFMGYNPDRIIELSSQMNADQINTGLEILEKVRLHKIDEENKIVEFLNSIGIRSLKDIEYTKQKDSWSWSWLQIILIHWEFLKPYCLLEDNMKIESYPKSDQDKLALNSLLDRCCSVFQKEISKAITYENNDPIKVAMATNMISVGVDIPRLNVMSISGQPKTTAEYIQASSRVGREFPGIVFVLYNQAKNRDRSHYENFKDYHQAYYKYVESTSVTPFSLPALEKTLDSVIISMVRAKYFKSDKNAFLTENAKLFIREIGDDLCRRFQSIQTSLKSNDIELNSKRKKDMESMIEDLIRRWELQGDVKFTTFVDVMKNNRLSKENLDSILFMDAKYRDHHLTKDKLFAMTSLRDVDTSSNVKIKSYID